MLLRGGGEVWTVAPGDEFAALSERSFAIRPDQSGDYATLLSDLRASGGVPENIVHLWTASPADRLRPPREDFETDQSQGLFSLIFLAQALRKSNVAGAVQISVVSTGLHAINDGDTVSPGRSTLLGPCKVLPQEYPTVRCKSIDIGDWRGREAAAAEQVLDEIASAAVDPVVAYRDGLRWVQEFEPSPIGSAPADPGRLRKGGRLPDHRRSRKYRPGDCRGACHAKSRRSSCSSDAPQFAGARLVGTAAGQLARQMR